MCPECRAIVNFWLPGAFEAGSWAAGFENPILDACPEAHGCRLKSLLNPLILASGGCPGSFAGSGWGLGVQLPHVFLTLRCLISRTLVSSILKCPFSRTLESYSLPWLLASPGPGPDLGLGLCLGQGPCLGLGLRLGLSLALGLALNLALGWDLALGMFLFC